MFYTFVMFNNLLQIQPFLKNLNNKHYRMKFTLEFKRNSSIVFLDMNIVKHKDSFATNLYKKPTFTGLGCRYDRAISVHKTGSITCLIDCAYKISSTYQAFCSELVYFRMYFSQTKYPVLYPQLCLKRIFVNKFSVSSFFNCKYHVPKN